jgi:hypothetical protein
LAKIGVLVGVNHCDTTHKISAQFGPPQPAAVLEALEDVCASRVFSHSERMIRFLRFVVERKLAGEHQDIREFVIGMEVFDRARDYDPKIDTIVRVEARRLRKKLEAYYAGPGAGDQVRIDVPRPGYAPVFTIVPVPQREPAGLGVALQA